MNKNEVLSTLSYLSKKYLSQADNEVLQQKIANPDKATAKFFLAELTLKTLKPFSDDDLEKLQDIDYYGL